MFFYQIRYVKSRFFQHQSISHINGDIGRRRGWGIRDGGEGKGKQGTYLPNGARGIAVNAISLALGEREVPTPHILNEENLKGLHTFKENKNLLAVAGKHGCTTDGHSSFVAFKIWMVGVWMKCITSNKVISLRNQAVIVGYLFK